MKCSLLLSLLASGVRASVEVRGVAPSEQSKFLEGEFSCLVGERRVVLPLGRVNDDFCDCDQGEDEPGTAACSHLLGSQFHCENGGFFPAKVIPFLQQSKGPVQVLTRFMYFFRIIIIVTF
jgi:protein kinase C substrate 80K-H